MPVIPSTPPANAWEIGPIVMDIRDPHLSWTGGPDVHGIRTARISGIAHRPTVFALQELVANPRRRVVIGGHEGVPEVLRLNWVGFVGGMYDGEYLLDVVTVGDVEHRWAGPGLPDFKPLPFSLDAAYLGPVAT